MAADDRRDRCQTIYVNLLLAKEQAQHPNASTYVRELAHTARCDQFYDFAKLRASFQGLIGAEAMQRISEFKETEEDERRAEQAVTHYHSWTAHHLESALTWGTWLWYNSMHRVEKTVGMVTLGGALFGGWKFVRPSHRKWQNT